MIVVYSLMLYKSYKSILMGALSNYSLEIIMVETYSPDTTSDRVAQLGPTLFALPRLGVYPMQYSLWWPWWPTDLVTCYESL
jgi:hypothetical protein